MNYHKEELKKGINVHFINTDKFKTNLISVFLTTPINKQEVTKSALVPMVLRRGSQNMPTSEEISKTLENMYGASFNCGVDKIGDDEVLKFYIEAINNEYLPEEEDLFTKTINCILEIVFHPTLENGVFKQEYINSEKENLRQIIEGKIDNKSQYAQDRCIEEMYQDKPYGVYRYGYIEDLEAINNTNLYEYYQKLIAECKIDIFVSGKLQDNVIDIMSKNENINKLNEREPNYIVNHGNDLEKRDKINEVVEQMNVAQGKLAIGLNIHEDSKESRYIALVYNAILGGIPTSKLFQNVREKASLAYTAASSYARQKNNIFIKCGIEIENYEKAVDIIKQQLEDMKQGNFTDEDVDSAKISIIATIKFIPDEQDTAITYYFGQELSEYQLNYDEYADTINKITKEDIMSLAKKIDIDTIYFLKG